MPTNHTTTPVPLAPDSGAVTEKSKTKVKARKLDGEPKPVQRPRPPIMIGSGGEKLGLRVVAEHAGIWNCPTQMVEEFRHNSRVLDQHCAAVGRDPDDITRSVQLIVRCQTRRSPPPPDSTSSS